MMILPSEFINSISPDARDDFLDHLILTHQSNESYEGNLSADRDRLLTALKKGDMFIEHSEESESFGLISRQDAKEKGFNPSK